MLPKAMVTPAAHGLQELKIQGLFPHPHWMVFLLSGLADRQVSVVGGRAIQQINHSWLANFQLDFRRSATQPEGVDYLLLAGQRASHAPTAPPRLTSFSVVRRPDSALEMTVHGPDQLGFLGKLLGEVSLLALYPTEMEINTLGGQIKDKIVLRGIAGSAPSESIEHSLRDLLQGFVATS